MTGHIVLSVDMGHIVGRGALLSLGVLSVSVDIG